MEGEKLNPEGSLNEVKDRDVEAAFSQCWARLDGLNGLQLSNVGLPCAQVVMETCVSRMAPSSSMSMRRLCRVNLPTS